MVWVIEKHVLDFIYHTSNGEEKKEKHQIPSVKPIEQKDGEQGITAGTPEVIRSNIAPHRVRKLHDASRERCLHKPDSNEASLPNSSPAHQAEVYKFHSSCLTVT
eukprot:scpid56755/ scgid29450/ 